MEDIVQHLLREIQALRQEVRAFQRCSPSSRSTIEAMLRRRGIQEVKYTSASYRLLPEYSSKEAEDELYHLMQKYSFRIFARDLIAFIDHATPRRLARYCSEEVAREYLAVLIQHRIVRQIGEDTYQLTNSQVINFGDTLEWFIAQVMEREFDSPAIWGVRFKHHEIGGDYDVLSAVEGRLTYIEVKSSPPKHIEMSEIAAFLDRVHDLRPDVAIFLEDTHLRMKDKLAEMFAEEMRCRYGSRAEQDSPVQRLHDEIFTIQHSLFITNTKPDVIANLRICLKHALAGIAWPPLDN
ncbi:hypothetical protein U27_00133 [Candidatus Vecturithrix granuli]|uniref:Uncharacterized protein n=1 Tax=Vecturithrix granuli TaxID=1499967 RepID=A0A081C6N7_VECG1|nr:hypothetical protein U27_00133 [Candidatus Vecturithrix granuli]